MSIYNDSDVVVFAVIDEGIPGCDVEAELLVVDGEAGDGDDQLSVRELVVLVADVSVVGADRVRVRRRVVLIDDHRPDVSELPRRRASLCQETMVEIFISISQIKKFERFEFFTMSNYRFYPI